ncbi:potassium transporter Kup [Cellvibrio mixtus]|uniref:potassium transporter Kup n=1 Tax=Cellvibrio mixtus TaxID=39650 RepID=UPI0006933E3D|nr:potassium transporter Kup [Cellvibrio mixtus]
MTISSASAQPDSDIPVSPAKQSLAALTLAAIGVVYGDIGTSPLYTVKEIFAPATGVPLDSHHIVGAISTIFWALMLVVTLKYVILILRADNRGEGGSLALTALAAQTANKNSQLRRWILLIGLFGATLFYGDSIITPAISVLGAMEGLEVATPALKPLVVPITLAILISLFLVQRFGTGAMGKIFGPIVTLWFLMLAVSGVAHIIVQPAILAALNPLEAWQFLNGRGWYVFAAIGAIVLALTGAEALYADMGHFGRKPIQLAWTWLVFPSLALNYMGQGALLLADPAAIANPFYKLFPQTLIWPALIIASLAAIIASQAVISGAYSMTRQAIQLGFLPRMTVHHTSAREAGQIYMPAVNWMLLAGVIAVVLFFGSSSGLAGAYGIAVTVTMATTTCLTFFVVRGRWKLPLPIAIVATVFFLAVDIFLIAGCALKFLDGGWFSLLVAALLFLIMSTWQRGRAIVMHTIHRDGVELEPFLQTLRPAEIQRAARTAIYMVADATTVPQALLHNLKHNQVLHERNLVLTVHFKDDPWVGDDARVHIEELGNTFWRVTLNFGFMDVPDVPRALKLCEQYGLVIPQFQTSYFLSRESIVSTPGSGMAPWRERLFSTMSRNAGGVVEFFRLPDNAVIELGTRIQI